MNAKIHIRRQPDGNYYIQGIIPKDNDDIGFIIMTDVIAAVEIEIKLIEDRTQQYAGKSNKLIAQEGFK